MATYILGSIGTALGGPIGGIVGALLGGLADRQLTSMLTPNTTTNTTTVGPRLTELSLTNSSEGAILPRVVGRARLGGQVIWCAQFKEVAETSSTSQGGGGGGKGGGGKQTATTTTTVYKYYLSFAVAFCEGNPHAQLGRVWINGTETDLSKYTFRWYTGSQGQYPDSLIQATEGSNWTPAFRGTAYIVFEDLPLEEYGNRMPQVTAEVVVPLDAAEADDLQNIGRAFQLIPGTGEVAYGTTPYTDGQGDQAQVQNVHNNSRLPDAALAIDQLNQFQQSLEAVSLVVSWFGTDLRADQCRVIPKIEDSDRALTPTEWYVGSYTRGTAEEVSRDAFDRPVFGGTPSDNTVLETVDYLIARGKRVVFYPFILMDIPAGNSLPNPYSAGAGTGGQPAFPWRGRITCSPAIGYAGTPDKTATAASQVNTWFTRAEGYRAMVLHYATLLAGRSIDAFIIGSELVGLTNVRGASNSFPAVTQLVSLASAVSAILGGGVKVGYAADWSEYHSYRPADGSNDVYFNLDPLWASSDIDFVGIDNYLPMSDWRDGSTHLDYNAAAGPVSEYDPSYLKANIEGGEYYDWYYASPADRASQTRTPIADVAYGQPWTFRQKDIRNWWANNHKNRPGGVPNTVPTAWTPQSKPVWFTEFGCPAINKGTNQPNVFYDPKSSESFFPYFSSGTRDDFIQRLYLEATLQYWRDNSPTSGVYGDKMLKINNMFIWTWDARPFPAYPMQSDVWSDGGLWKLGHWLSGRIDGAVLARLVASICRRVGLADSLFDVSGLYGPGGLVRGLYVANVSSERDILEQLARFYLFNAYESEGKLKFTMSINTKTASVAPGDLVLKDGRTYPVGITRKQEIDLPKSVKLTYLDEFNGYNSASVDGQKGTGNAQNIIQYSFPIVSTAEFVRALGITMIHQAWRARESGDFVLPPSYASVEQGDGLYVPVGSRVIGVRVDQIDQTSDRAIEFSGFDTTLFAPPTITVDDRLPIVQGVFQSAILEFMDVPLVSGSEELPHAPRLATYAKPWPGGVNVLKSDGAGGFVPIQTLLGRAQMGQLNSALYSGPTDRWDRSNVVDVQVYEGVLTTMSEEQVLASNGNAIAIKNAATGLWEVLQFATASLQSAGVYRLSHLLRGQLDTSDAMVGGPYPIGSRLVVMEPALIRALNASREQAPLHIDYRWGPVTYPSTDPTYLTRTKWGSLRGLRPYTPACPLLQRNSGTGDLVLTWKRRTRFDGDGWEQTEVPLNEEAEQYKLVILTGPGGTVKRTLVLTTPSYTYSAASQVADFGSAQTQVYVQVSQYGAAYGNYGGVLEGYVYMGSST